MLLSRKSAWEKFLRFISGSNAIASFWIFLMMLFITADVTGRVVFNHPLTGTAEIVKVTIVGVLFLQMPHTLWSNRHIRSELILGKIGIVKRELLNLANYLIGAILFVAIFVSSWPATITSLKIMEYEGEGALHVPVSPIRISILLGSAFSTVVLIAKAIQSLQILRNRPDRNQ